MVESSERIAKLLEKLKSNDSEVKVDGITKLQNEFTLGEQISDPDDVIAALKTSVRIPNQHIYTASLSAISALFPVLVNNESEDNDVHTSQETAPLRHALLAFLAPGGIIDRLGDNREKPRECARDALVSAGTVAFKHSAPAPPQNAKANHSGKVPETSLAIFERHLRDLGFGSKVAKVREQSILTLVHLRRGNPAFPIRSFLPYLVDTLEDSDGAVRDCARNSVVQIFTAPGVTDGARADLKKEMTKKNVRKGIVDGVINQLLANSGQGTDVQTPDQPSSTSNRPFLSSRQPTASTLTDAPSSRTVSLNSSVMGESLESKPSEGEEVAVVYIASARDLEQEFASMVPPFEGRESEHNWQARDRAIFRVRGMLKGDVHQRYPDAFMEGLKAGFVSHSLKTLASLRTTVAISTCALYEELIHALRHAYEPLVEITLGPLLRMGSLTKKIVATRAQDAAKEILLHGHCHPRIVMPLLWSGIQDKNIQQRQFTLGHIQTVLENNATKAKGVYEASGGLELFERSIKKALGDPNAGIRDRARVTFWVFHNVWKDRADIIAATLDATSRKQLDKASPSGQSQLSAASSGTESKKSSVAAAIAASRAKARQIAADPPSLRHAATSHASSMASQARKVTSPISSPPSRSSLLPAVNSKRLSGNFQRSSTSPAVVNLTSPSSKSNSSISPPSSPTNAMRRQLPEARSSPPTQVASSVFTPQKASSSNRSSLSARSLSPPSAANKTAAPKRASGIFSPPKSVNRSVIMNANETLTISPHASDDESLMRLRAPHSDDDDSNESLQMASFSDAFGTPQKGLSLLSELTPSTNPVKVPGPVVEDALRAQAEQAESAAERLLEELSEPDVTIDADRTVLMPPMAPAKPPASNGHGSFTVTITRNNTAPINKTVPSVANGQKTPMKQQSEVMRQVAAYQDSPAYKKGTPLTLNMLKDNRNESSWWLKRMALLKQGNQEPTNSSSPETLTRLLSALEDGSATKDTLKELILLCSQNPVAELDFDAPLSNDTGGIWQGGAIFTKLFDALSRYLSCDKDEETLEYGLIVLWEFIDNQQPYLEGREAELLSLLFQLRYANKPNVAEASNTIRDSLTTRIDPVYGLTTVHSSLKKFLAQPIPEYGDAETRALSHAFGLLAIGKLILRLPQEVLEEELPRLQLTLSQGLNDSQLLVREAAAAAITAAQLVLRDETYLFTLLASLTDEKKNLLTYLFDKHGARGAVEGVTTGNTQQTGLDRLEKEMSRLDRRTSIHQRRP